MRRAVVAAVIAGWLVGLSGCGAAGQKTLTQGTLTQGTLTQGSANSWQWVTFARARFEIPSSWTVHNLSRDPTRCVRFDQHAAYLGHTGASTNCPAGVFGRTEAVQVEPLDGQSRAHLLPTSLTQTVGGLTASVQPFSQTTHSLVAAFEPLGVVMTVTWSSHQDIAQQILNSLHAA